jgi:4-hydroxybenzoate polyprenyltransferase
MTEPAGLSTGRFWRGFVITLRPYLMFLSLAAGLAGLALTDLGIEVVIFGTVFFLTYGLGQALTDTFQTDTDALSAPYRPLVRGELRTRDVRVVALLGLAVCGLVFVVANPWSVVPAGAAVAGLASYTWFKRRWWGGPPWNAWIVATLPLIGWLCGGGSLIGATREPELGLVMGSAFFTYASFVLLGYLKDVDADAATGYDTVAVRFGRRPTIVLSFVHALVGLALSGLLVADGSPEIGGGVIWGAGFLALLAAHVRLWGVTEDSNAHAGVAWSALAFVAIHLGEAAMLRPSFTWPCAGLLAAAVITMRLRPSREQV